MSYINEALKKAQEMKDSGYATYSIIPEASDSGSGRFGIKVLLYSLSVLLLIVLIFSVRLWLYTSHDKKDQAKATEGRLEIKTGDSPSDKKELYDKAMSLYKAGRVMEAKKLYEAVVGLDPGYIEALNNLGIIYIHDKDFNAAKETLEKAVRLNPGYVESYYNLACLYAVKGETDQGLEYLKKAISLDANVREWAGNDSDLQSLKGSDEFNRIVSRQF